MNSTARATTVATHQFILTFPFHPSAERKIIHLPVNVVVAPQKSLFRISVRVNLLHIGTNMPFIGQSQTNEDEKHMDLWELGNMARDLEVDAIERETVRSHSTFPFNRFPREIIAEIFSNCLEHHVRMSSGNVPLLLCRVSSSWRELALTIPQLWASININLRHSNDVDPSTCAHIANAWLERSGTLPLTVAIGYFRRTKSPVLDAVLSIVCSYSSRWQNVAINSWVPVSFPQLGSLPLLRSFHLRASNSSPIIGFPFSRCPRLTQLSWPYPLDPLTHTQILGNQLSHVCLPGMSAIAALETIRLCPQLENFRVDLIANLGDRVDHLEATVQNSSLRTLTITCPPDCGPFFNSLILPELRNFSLTSSAISAVSSHRAFLDFLTRSNCKLYKLELAYIRP